jgi:gamma-glutamyltranspeptidase/glutathione hydrolase
LQDLQRYRTVERKPVCQGYRGYQLCGVAPPSSGGVAIAQMMGMLSHYDMAALGAENPHSWRLIGDATRLAFADKGQYIADPDVVDVPVKALLDDDYIAARAALLQGNKALKSVEALPSRELPSTSHLSIIDRYGNALSMTSSIENAFGSRIMVGGFLLNNQLTDFSFLPEREGVKLANRVEGGKRPMSSMAPVIALKEGKPSIITGSPGGSRIIGYVVQQLVALIDWGMNPQQAAAMPRLVNRFGVYDVEGVPKVARLSDGLQALGFEVMLGDMASGVHTIVIDDKGLYGGADPRREGVAIAGE